MTNYAPAAVWMWVGGNGAQGWLDGKEYVATQAHRAVPYVLMMEDHRASGHLQAHWRGARLDARYSRSLPEGGLVIVTPLER